MKHGLYYGYWKVCDLQRSRALLSVLITQIVLNVMVDRKRNIDDLSRVIGNNDNDDTECLG